MLKKALFIDDAFARPTVADFQKKLGALRQFLADNSSTKDWFDREFGLSGSHTGRRYFEPILSSPEAVLRFWSMRQKSPSKMKLVREVFGDLVSDLNQHHAPLEKIESILKAQGWKVIKLPSLPSVDDVAEDVELIVMDYLLSGSIPSDIEAKVSESIEFLKLIIQRAKKSPAAVHPFVILISSLPSAIDHAHAFRKGTSSPGGLFRFVGKVSVDTEFPSAVDTLASQGGDLQRFRRVQVSLEGAVVEAAQKLLDRVVDLELEDIATLYTGQLVTEKEPLSDYLGWLSGQLLTSSIQRNISLAECSADLPSESYDVLLGHCEPTQNLSKIFSDFSSVKTSSGELYKVSQKSRQVRFGDLFVRHPRKRRRETQGEQEVAAGDNDYLMVISQTCDLLQGKISNGQVLCVQGLGRIIQSTEIELLRVTIRQMFSDGDVLVRDGDQFVQIEWGDAKDLVTVKLTSLSKEAGVSYIGRLNEIYALEVQHKALHQLGRIGVPIVPGYRVFFGGAEIRIFTAKGELGQFLHTLNNNSVLAILRCDKPKQKLLFSLELHRWVRETLERISVSEGFPSGLAKGVTDLLSALKASGSFNVNVKFTRDGKVEGFNRDPISSLGEEKVVPLPGSVEFLLDGLPRTDKQPTQVRVQLRLLPSLQFHNDTLSI
ncbi:MULTISPECIES: hypothetical protein [Pseudomonas]|nr:hypothetical protein [Pseudomonas aeruginosa]ELQ3328999.1 hypothetical protein [Pseudomonas aeruginosa]KAA5625170.1 hypothetical protein F3H11_21155 [Pseudomonas aeruginosa]KAA5643408.1 hypothetical protein F3G63_18500 [Pseudomonas aeruginosa]KAB5464133.1 hypothetical protein F8137_17555 [Pseudomonas aeruginosa]MBA5053027.1 hypothetical protein [Pseudomonas aeruginosa]